MIFLGAFEHHLDSKNRLSLPSKFVSKLSKFVVINKGFDGCLELRDTKNFENYANSLMTLSQNKHDARVLVRQLLANASDLEIDSAKRILIPSNLLLEANLTKNITIIGLGNKIEIWDKESYLAFKKATDPKFEEIAERIDDGKL